MTIPSSSALESHPAWCPILAEPLDRVNRVLQRLYAPARAKGRRLKSFTHLVTTHRRRTEREPHLILSEGLFMGAGCFVEDAGELQLDSGREGNAQSWSARPDVETDGEVEPRCPGEADSDEAAGSIISEKSG